MPIPKFNCRSCGKEFAKIVVKPEYMPRNCPVCGSEDIVGDSEAFISNGRYADMGSCLSCESCGPTPNACSRPASS
ncbi:MAG: hypothetical protein V2B18_00545 [Pseudomonadota bacterium]